MLQREMAVSRVPITVMLSFVSHLEGSREIVDIPLTVHLLVVFHLSRNDTDKAACPCTESRTAIGVLKVLSHRPDRVDRILKMTFFADLLKIRSDELETGAAAIR